jgi:hypothetical protein
MAALVRTPEELKNVPVLARVKVTRGSSVVPLTKFKAKDGPLTPKNRFRPRLRVSGSMIKGPGQG